MANAEPEMPVEYPETSRLFPLPGVVLFPGIAQALHIFEPRYREMTADALASDQLLTICQLKDSQAAASEADVFARPAVHEVSCISRIAAHNELPDGKYNLMVVGLRRVRLIREIDTEHAYRVAKIEVLEERAPSESVTREMRASLVNACKENGLLDQVAHSRKLQEQIYSGFSLGLLVDLISYAAGFESGVRQQLLEVLDVEQRCRLLLDNLAAGFDEANSDRQPFPPDFSLN